MKLLKSRSFKQLFLPTLAGLILFFAFNNCNSGFISSGIDGVLPSPGIAPTAILKTYSKIVATGSSSIELWSNIEKDLLPLEVVETGISGSIAQNIYDDLNSLVFTHSPEAVLLYVGENDVASGAYSPTVTRDNVRKIVDAILARIPQGKIFILSLKPSPLRIAKWPEFQTTNSLLKAYADSDARLVFIDVATPLLNSDGTPKASYYQSDRLHLSLEGYAVWTNIIRPVLLEHSGL